MSYHHGDLPAAVLRAVDDLIREEGIGAVSLRAVARRAGVSHAAPAHHFGDKAGLLTAFATQGCELLRERLEAEHEPPPDGHSPLFSLGVAYVGFAIEHPAHFAVMLRPDYVHNEDPDYQAAREAAFGKLMDAVRVIRDDLDADDPQVLHAATGAWALVHGIARLWLDGNLSPELTELAPEDATAAVMQAWGRTLFRSAGMTSDSGEDRPCAS